MDPEGEPNGPTSDGIDALSERDIMGAGHAGVVTGIRPGIQIWSALLQYDADILLTASFGGV